MVNTNGVRIARDEAFARRLATYMPDFEVYLQFDSLKRDPLMQLRGADLSNTRLRALERLNEMGVSTTLVVTVEPGVNDGELGAIIELGSGSLACAASPSNWCNKPAALRDTMRFITG